MGWPAAISIVAAPWRRSWNPTGGQVGLPGEEAEVLADMTGPQRRAVLLREHPAGVLPRRPPCLLISTCATSRPPHNSTAHRGRG